MHHSTRRMIQIYIKNVFLGLGLLSLFAGYAIALNMSENVWVQTLLASAPIVTAFGYTVWAVSKMQMEREQREQERTMMELSRDPTDYSQFNQLSKASSSQAIYNVYKDDL